MQDSRGHPQCWRDALLRGDALARARTCSTTLLLVHIDSFISIVLFHSLISFRVYKHRVLAGLSSDRQAARDIVDCYGLDYVLQPLLAVPKADDELTCNVLRTLYNIAVEGTHDE